MCILAPHSENFRHGCSPFMRSGHISYRVGTELRLLFLPSRRRAVLSGISAISLLVASVSHGDVSLGVPSRSGARTAPFQEARELRCGARNVGPYQATTPQFISRFGTGIPCARIWDRFAKHSVL